MHAFYRVSSTEEYLYHYTSAASLEKILSGRRLRMNPFARTNDPKESKNWRFDFTDVDDDATLASRYSELGSEATRIAKSRSKLLCFTRDAQEALTPRLDWIYHRGFARPRMWAQYAAQHSGACLIFSFPQLREAVTSSFPPGSLVWGEDVTYTNPPVAPPLGEKALTLNARLIKQEGLERAVRQHVQDYYRALFFEKLVDWRDEEEFRWLLWESHGEFHEIEYDDRVPGSMGRCSSRRRTVAAARARRFPRAKSGVSKRRRGVCVRHAWHIDHDCFWR